MKIMCLVLLALAILNGCVTTAPENQPAYRQAVKDLRPHQLYVDEYGNLLNPGTRERICGEQGEESSDRKKHCIDSEKSYVDEIIANFQKLKAKKPKMTLTVFIHGGLNTFKSATERVDKDKVIIPMLDEDKYPLFISWNSEPISNYKDHLVYLRRGKLERILGPLSTPFVLLEDTLRSIARIPASTYNVVFGQNKAFDSILTKYNKEEAQAQSARSYLQQEGGFHIHENGVDEVGLTRKDWLTVWNPVKLVTAPFLDGLGTGAWDSMLRRTDLILRKDVSANVKETVFEPTAVSKFLNEFSIEFGDVDVTVIGHSMGAIVANNIISKYPEIKFKNIVYMAAACRLKDIEYVVVPYLKRNSFAHFYNLSLHPYRDISENVAYDFLPRGSLLMWIDQTLGEPNSLADRTAGYWFNIIRAANNIFSKPDARTMTGADSYNDVRKRVHLTRFGADKSPKAHGDFNDHKLKYWQQTFWEGEID